MKKTKIELLFAVCLMFVWAFFTVAVFAKEQDQNSEYGDNATTSVENNGHAASVESNNKEYATSTESDDKEYSTSTEAEGQNNEIDSEEHKSEVVKFVKKLLDVADREDGIGEKVREIARKQNDSASTTVEAIEKIKERSPWKTFFIGSDYKNLGALRSEIAQTQDRLRQLDNLIEKAQSAADKTELQNQAKTLEQEQQKINDFVNTNENKFSLFGWFVRLFSK